MSGTRLPPIALRIKAAIINAHKLGYTPRSLYLTPDDREALLLALNAAGTWQRGDPEPDEVVGLQLRRVSGRGRSRLYCRHGVSVTIPVRPPP